MFGASSRKLATWVFYVAMAGMGTCAPAVPVFAGSPATIAVGETASAARTGRGHAHALALGDALRRELGTIDGVRVAPTSRRADWVVRGSVTRLDRSSRDGDNEVHCEVSLILAEARGGSVRMMLSGRAGARGPEAADHLERVALDAAVRGALRPLGQQLIALR